MPDVKEVVNGLEMSYKYSNVDENNTLVPQWIVLHSIELLKAQEPRVLSLEGMTEQKFMTHIITEICDYAVENDMEPDDTLSTIADNIKALLEISTFNGWEGR